MANNGIYYSSGNTLNFTTDNTTWATLSSGGTFVINTVSGGTYLNLPSSTFTGGTVTGPTEFTNGLTANTISATTYQNLPVSAVTNGTGISASTSNGTVTIVNTSPDQTVTISGGTGITTGGTYPNFTLVNSAPDQTVTITGGTNIQIAGTYPNFGVNFTGSTSGEYLPLSGGTVTGGTVFTAGVTANTLSNVNYILFNTTATTSHTEGQIHWNDETKTLEIDTDKTGVTYEAGQNTLVRVTNETGSPLTIGTVVYINGAQGQRPTVTKASYELDQSSARTLGFIAATINDNNQGYVTTNGLLRNVNTNSYTAGTQLYLYTGGTVTNVRPIAPNHEVRLGYVIVQNSTTGVIYVNIQNGYELEELHDVQITAKTNNDIIYWDSSAGVWKNTNSPVFTSLTAGTISAATYQNLPVSAVTSGSGISASTSNGVVTVSNTQVQGLTGITAGSGISASTTNNVTTITNTQVQGITGITAGSGISASTSNNVTTITTNISASSITNATTVGQNLITLTNPSAVTYLKVNADNTVTTISLATLKSDLGISSQVLANDSTTTTTNTFEDIGLSFAVTSGKVYTWTATFAAGATSTSTFGVTGPTYTFMNYRFIMQNAATTIAIFGGVANDAGTNATFSSNGVCTADGVLKPSANGTFKLRFRSLTSGTLTVRAGAKITWEEVL